MENATKALIIAASIIVVLLIISLGMGILNSTDGIFSSSKSTMTELEIQSFNDKFSSYEGSNKSSSQIVSLLRTIQNSNSANENQVAVKIAGLDRVYDSCRYYIKDENNVFIKGPASSNYVSVDEMIKIINTHKGHRYNVSFYYCNQATHSTSNNRALKPAIGCLLLVVIDKN